MTERDVWRERLDRVDARIAGWMARHGVALLRVSLGVVFLWFGMLKLFPGLSPAEGLAGRTIAVLTHGVVPPPVSVPMLGVWESLIGIGLVTGAALRLTLVVLFVQMSGTVAPLILFPSDVFVRQPFVLTMEGQYIVKNLVLVSAAFVIGATVRGGRLKAEPTKEYPRVATGEPRLYIGEEIVDRDPRDSDAVAPSVTAPRLLRALDDCWMRDSQHRVDRDRLSPNTSQPVRS